MTHLWKEDMKSNQSDSGFSVLQGGAMIILKSLGIKEQALYH